MIWLRLALRNVPRNHRRTLICATTVAVGTCAVLLAMGYMSASFYGVRESAIHGGVGHVQLALRGEFDGYAERPLQFGMEPTRARELRLGVEALEQVHFTFRRVAFEGLISNGEQTLTFSGAGVEPLNERRLSRYWAPVVEGDGLDAGSSDDPFRIVVGEELARLLGARPGDHLTLLTVTESGGLNAIDVRVAGIHRSGVKELDRRSALLPIEAAQELLLTERVSRLIIVLRDTAATDAVAATLAGSDDDVAVRTWYQLSPYYTKLVTLLRNQFSVFGIIILLAVFLSTVNTIVMSIMERIPEIGTLRALGIPNGRIRRTFVYEAALIGLFGACAGAGVAFALSGVVNQLGIQVPPPPGRTTSYPLLIFVTAQMAAVMALLMTLLGAFAAWLPSRRVARLRIVDAIRHV